MNTTMPEHKVTRMKGIAMSAFAVVALAGGGYAIGSTDVLGTQPASATSDYRGGHGQDKKSTSSEDAAMVVSAVELYQKQKGIDPGLYQVTELDVDGEYARGKVVNNDSPSVFYAVKENDRWSVIFSGQSELPQATSEQYKFPSSWRTETDWQS